MTTPDEVLAYWFTPAPRTAEDARARMGFWFSGGDTVDREIRERFGGAVQQAQRGELDAWETAPQGALALIILLDQFSRNLHRGTPQSFANDEKALALARRGHDSGRFDAFDTLEFLFSAMPFCHSENLDDQVRSMALVTRNALRAPEHLVGVLNAGVDSARKHLDVVARFGRFPHRNETLGRLSTETEREYLEYLKLAKTWL